MSEGFYQKGNSAVFDYYAIRKLRRPSPMEEYFKLNNTIYCHIDRNEPAVGCYCMKFNPVKTCGSVRQDLAEGNI